MYMLCYYQIFKTNSLESYSTGGDRVSNGFLLFFWHRFYAKTNLKRQKIIKTTGLRMLRKKMFTRFRIPTLVNIKLRNERIPSNDVKQTCDAITTVRERKQLHSGSAICC